MRRRNEHANPSRPARRQGRFAAPTPSIPTPPAAHPGARRRTRRRGAPPATPPPPAAPHPVRRRGRFVTGPAAARFALAGALLATAAAAGAQEPPAAPQEHADAQALENPVEATRESLAIGRQRYVFLCRQCHGNRGRGDGDMSHAGGIPSDFTDDVWQHGASDGEIFTVIREGVSADMQGYGNQLRDEDIWHLVNYVKSLSR